MPDPAKFDDLVVLEMPAFVLMFIHSTVARAVKNWKGEGPALPLISTFLSAAEDALIECGALDQDDIKRIRESIEKGEETT